MNKMILIKHNPNWSESQQKNDENKMIIIGMVLVNLPDNFPVQQKDRLFCKAIFLILF